MPCCRNLRRIRKGVRLKVRSRCERGRGSPSLGTGEKAKGREEEERKVMAPFLLLDAVQGQVSRSCGTDRPVKR